MILGVGRVSLRGRGGRQGGTWIRCEVYGWNGEGVDGIWCGRGMLVVLMGSVSKSLGAVMFSLIVVLLWKQWHVL